MCSEIIQHHLIIFPFAEVNQIWIWFLRYNSFAVLSCIHHLKFILPDFIIHTEFLSLLQGGITCGAIDELRKSSKTIDERVIINFPDKNVVIARFRDKTAYV